MRTFSHGGTQFLLGRDENGEWAIWRLGEQWGPPVHRFGNTDAGWSSAVALLRSWDPAATPLRPDQIRQLQLRPPFALTTPYEQYPAELAFRNGVRSSNGMATTGGTIGIVGAVLSLIPFLGILIGLLLGPLAIIFSGIGLARSSPTGTGRGMATAGLVLGILTVVFKLTPGINLL